MSNVLFLSKKALAFLFIVAIAAACLLSFAESRDPPLDTSAAKANTRKAGGGGKGKARKSSSEILSEVMNLMVEFGGENVKTMFTDMKRNFSQATVLAQSLANPEVINSINASIRGVISSFSEALKSSDLTSSEVLQADDIAKFLDVFMEKYTSNLKQIPGFSMILLTQIQTALPLAVSGLTEMYSNLVSSTGFGLTKGMLDGASTMLYAFDRPRYVNQETFESIVSFPEEIQKNMEKALDEVIGNFIDPAQLDMMLGMAKMYLGTMTRREHDDL